jgi:hypothetical protein
VNAPAGARPSVLAVLDDAAAGETLLELSCALARTLQRELTLVYVESARSLVAAALPITQVLPHAGLAWQPLRPQDVEQGFRAHAARLRELATRIALPDAVNWSLRVMRGELPSAARDLAAESDLLFLATAPPPQPPTPARRRPVRPRRVVAVAGDPGAASGSDRRALAVAQQLAQALAAELETMPADAAARLAGGAGVLDTLTRPDVLVLPRAPLTPAARSALLLLRLPVLIVG